MTADFMLVEVDLNDPDWEGALARAEAEALGIPLDVRLISDDPGAIRAAVASLAGVKLERLGLFSPISHVTEAAPWKILLEAAGSMPIELVGGSRAHFAELNRGKGRLPAGLPAITFSSTPQMHARERAQLTESIGMQRLTAEQAVRMSQDRPVHVGPITLRPRFNAVATSGRRATPAEITDDRQSSRALAAWTIASAAAFAVPGVASLTYFEASGSRGARRSDGAPYPVAEALAALHGLARRPLLRASVLPEHVWLLAAGGDSTTVLAANLRSAPTELSIEFGDVSASVPLRPFGWARVELQ